MKKLPEQVQSRIQLMRDNLKEENLKEVDEGNYSYWSAGSVVKEVRRLLRKFKLSAKYNLGNGELSGTETSFISTMIISVNIVDEEDADSLHAEETYKWHAVGHDNNKNNILSNAVTIAKKQFWLTQLEVPSPKIDVEKQKPKYHQMQKQIIRAMKILKTDKLMFKGMPLDAFEIFRAKPGEISEIYDLLKGKAIDWCKHHPDEAMDKLGNINKVEAMNLAAIVEGIDEIKRNK